MSPGIDMEAIVGARVLEVVYERGEQTREQLQVVQPVLRASSMAGTESALEAQATRCAAAQVLCLRTKECASRVRTSTYHELRLDEQVVGGVHHVRRVVDVVIRVVELCVAGLHVPEERLELRQRDLHAHNAPLQSSPVHFTPRWPPLRSAPIPPSQSHAP